MRSTVTLDDDLLATAMRLTGITNRSQLVREGLQTIVARESARRLALLGGSQPDFVLPARRRPAQPRRKKPATP
jgi:Arc/MetJ family transcription regulator